MAHGITLELRKVPRWTGRIWTPQEWAQRPGTIPGDPLKWLKGCRPKSRRTRRGRECMDIWFRPPQPVKRARRKKAQVA